MKQRKLDIPGYELVVFCEDSASGLKAYVAVHSTALGPACGGIRMLPYASDEEALGDVLRLSKGMSYKSALAGIGFGGGKSVICHDPSDKPPELFHAFGKLVQGLGGKYIAAKDMNISSSDLLQVKTTTDYVLGIEGLAGSSGDPSPTTARGILRALEATVEELNGSKSLKGVRVAIQGIGYVGYRFAEMARQQGADLWVTDIDTKTVERAVRELGAKAVPMDSIYDVECDVFSPCARGAVLNPTTIERLRCKAIVGAANNQLLSESDGVRLHEKGILYAPDYVINSGGIINIFIEYEGSYDQGRALAKADEIYPTLKEIFRRAKATNTPPFVVADKMAEEKLSGR